MDIPYLGFGLWFEIGWLGNFGCSGLVHLNLVFGRAWLALADSGGYSGFGSGTDSARSKIDCLEVETLVSTDSPQPAVQEDIENSPPAHPGIPYLDCCWHSEKEWPGPDCSVKKEPGRDLEGKLLRCFEEQQAIPGKDVVEPIEGMVMHLTWELQKTDWAHWMEC